MKRHQKKSDLYLINSKIYRLIANMNMIKKLLTFQLKGSKMKNSRGGCSWPDIGTD